MDVVYKNIQKRYGEEKLAKLLELLGGVSEWRGKQNYYKFISNFFEISIKLFKVSLLR